MQLGQSDGALVTDAGPPLNRRYRSQLTGSATANRRGDGGSVRRGCDADNRLVEPSAAHRALEGGIAEGEDATIRSH